MAIPTRLTTDNLIAGLAAEASGVEVVDGDSTATSASDRPKVAAPRSRIRTWTPKSISLGSDVEGTAASMVAAVEDALPVASLPERPVGLACGRTRDPGVRLLVAWSLVRGAPLALEPNADLAASAIVWVRPHVAVAPEESIVEVLGGLQGQKARWRRLRFVANSEGTPIADAGPWKTLGIETVAFGGRRR